MYLPIKSEITKLLYQFRITRLENIGITDFTDVDKVIRAIYLRANCSVLREGYLQAVSNRYPDIQAYKDILKYVSFDHMGQDKTYTYVTRVEYSFIEPSMGAEDYEGRGCSDDGNYRPD